MTTPTRYNYPANDLLWVSDDTPPAYLPGTASVRIRLDQDFNAVLDYQSHDYDPSTIFTRLPIAKPIPGMDTLDYSPSYIEMDPHQRYTYLHWLRDITQPIDIGYVFTYYYGLERHLLLGKRHKAFGEIVRLRRWHKNRRFQQYSRKALLFSCLHHHDIRPLLELSKQDQLQEFGAVSLLLAHKLKLNLSAENVAWVCAGLDRRPKAAIDQDFPLLCRCVEDVLVRLFGELCYPFGEISPSIDTERIRITAYSNYSFPAQIRFVDVPDFTKDPGFRAAMFTIFNKAYANFKKERAIQRKQRP